MSCLDGRGTDIVCNMHGCRLFVKEAMNCVDKKLFEDKCTRRGCNEIRKFVEALFPGQKLTSNTVVGQYLNAPIEVIKFQAAFAQAAGKGIEEFVHNVGPEAQRAEENIVREVTKGVQNVGREGQRIGDQAKKDVNNGLDWVGDRAGVRMPHF